MRSILIIENDVVVVKVWSKILVSQGYNVFYAYHVPEALDILNQEHIDIVLIDLRLNGVTPNGLEVYHHIRDILKSTMPILFITGLDSHADLHQQAKLATDRDACSGIFTRLLEKPARSTVLLDIVGEMCLYADHQGINTYC